MTVLSTYEKKARLTPGLVAVLPVTVTIISLGLDKIPLIAALTGGLLSAVGGPFLLSTAVGNVGRDAQDRDSGLFESWGGPPTTRTLRLREPTTNLFKRDLFRGAVERITGVALHDADQEDADPVGADQLIAAATDQLRHLGQEGGVPAVVNENAAYGFERNMFGFRHLGRAIAALSILIQGVAAFGPWDYSRPACLLGALVSAAILTVWIVKPSEPRAREAADRYAHQLLIAANNQETR